MTFLFPNISEEEANVLQKEFTQSTHPLAQKESIEVHPHTEGLVVQYEDGFSFCRRTHVDQTDTDVFRSFLNNPAETRYMPVTYEIDESPSTVDTILRTYEEKYGIHRNIDSLVYQKGNKGNKGNKGSKRFLIVKVPQEIIVEMMRNQGGTLFTYVQGPAASLRLLPSIRPLIPDSVEDSEVVRRVFATQYGEQQYEAANAYHQQVLSEVIANPNKAIRIGPIGLWNV